MHRLSYKLMLLLTILATLGGILTLLPWKSASYPNLIGYSSVCTYTPASTFFCFLLAGSSCFVRSTLIKDQSGSPFYRLRNHGMRLIPLVLLLIFTLYFHSRYKEIKAYFNDTVTAATVES